MYNYKYRKKINFKKYIFQKDILEYNISYNHFVWALVCFIIITFYTKLMNMTSFTKIPGHHELQYRVCI